MYKILLLFAVLNAFIFVSGNVNAKDRNEKIRDLGYIFGSEIKDDDDKDDKRVKKFYRNKKKSRLFTTKKLYENKDVIIYRAYDANGKKYTVTKRK